MKTAIAISPKNENQQYKLFARAAAFIIIDKDEKTLTKIMNPYLNDQEDAGRKVLKFLFAQGVKRVICGDFGSHVQDEAHQHNIQLVLVDTDKIFVEQFK